MTRHRCPSCRCDHRRPPEELLSVWVNQGVKAEGMNYFCEEKCRTCTGGESTDGRCPRDPYCKRYVTETEKV